MGHFDDQDYWRTRAEEDAENYGFTHACCPRCRRSGWLESGCSFECAACGFVDTPGDEDEP